MRNGNSRTAASADEEQHRGQEDSGRSADVPECHLLILCMAYSNYKHMLEVVGEGARGRQSAHPGPDHDGLLADERGHGPASVRRRAPAHRSRWRVAEHTATCERPEATSP